MVWQARWLWREGLSKALEEAETIGLPWTFREDAKAKHRPKSEKKQREILSPHVTGAIRLLLLTGCRLREILHLRWNEVDFERGLLLLPDSKTGRKTVFLSDAALEVLQNLPRVGRYVIAGGSPDQPRADLKRPWQRIAQHAELEDVRLHDLRHTFASIGAAQGMSLQMIGAFCMTVSATANTAMHPASVCATAIDVRSRAVFGACRTSSHLDSASRNKSFGKA